MLAWMRDFGGTMVSKVFLTLLALSFVAWGVGDYLMNVTGVWAVRVGDKEIAAGQVENMYRQRVNMLTQQLGRRLTEEELAQAQVAEGVVDEVVASVVLRNEAGRMGLVPAVKALQDEIAGTSAFRGEDGAFDAARYRNVLAQAGMTPDQFEREMAQDLSTRLLAQLVQVETGIAPEALAPQAALDHAELTLDVATLTLPGEAEVGQPDADALQRHYEVNQSRYEQPETRNLTVMEMTRDELMKTISVPEERVAEEYAANKAHYTVPEKRVVRHILLDSEAAARDAAKGISDLKSFARAADALSRDPGNAGGKGGQLGAITHDSVVPGFGDAAFALTPGKVSAPVQSPYGWHLIWVEGVEPARAQTLAEVKDEISGQLREAEADDAMTRLIEEVDDKVAAGESLQRIGQQLGLRVSTRSDVKASEPGMNAEVLSTAFMTSEGEVGLPVPLPDGGAVYVQVTKVSPARMPALAEMKPQVVREWQAVQRQMKLQERAGKVLAAARQPGTPMRVAAGGDASVSQVTVRDLQSAPDWLHNQLLQLFQLPEGALLKEPVMAGDKAYVVRLARRALAKPDTKLLDETARLFARRIQADVEALVVAHLQADASVSCNPVRLRQIFGRDVACR